ncbi:MAG: homoserine kinase [Clostridia bacterium]|nr:homoserine kinase [Clostridia bacterium]
MIKVRVPATSANMGPGFDCLGVAIQLYNYVSIEEYDGVKIDIIGDGEDFLPKDERNLVYQSAMEIISRADKTVKGLHLILENNIPITRGLGSSSASILGGMIAGNTLVGSPLTMQEILDIAAEKEGHADNVSPAVFGGFTVNSYNGKTVNSLKFPVPEDICFAVFKPAFFLKTKKSRSVLPNTVSHHSAATNTGNAAMLVGALLTGKYEFLKIGFSDELHQKFRKKLIPDMDYIFRVSEKHGALGSYLSGAGPTIISVISKENVSFLENIKKDMEKYKKWQVDVYEPDNDGAVIL